MTRSEGFARLRLGRRGVEGHTIWMSGKARRDYDPEDASSENELAGSWEVHRRAASPKYPAHGSRYQARPTILEARKVRWA